MLKFYTPYFMLMTCIFTTIKVYSQTELDERAIVNFKKGLGFYSTDSCLAINLKFRMQNIIGFTTVSGEDLSVSDIEARVKRLRLRFDGFIKNKNIAYYMQLGFSRYDQDWDNSHTVNVIRDAMVYYHFNKFFYIGYGQSKLPGNRQRVISSGSQQFVDRSVVNSNFTLDRDYGVFAYYSNNIGTVDINLKGTVSTGEGRVSMTTDKGLCYTGRLEILPLGKFTDNGDFFEGDLLREKTPKLSLAGGYSYNDNARKTLGQRGVDLHQQRDLKNILFDIILKYNGWALSSEYISRETSNPFTIDANNDTVTIYSGYGINTQLSYVFRNNYELAFRHAFVKPDNKTRYINPEDYFYTIAITRYVKNHLLKVQSNITYNYKNYYQINSADVSKKDKWLLQFQVELGI